MRVYRLRHKLYKGDVVLGMPPTYCKKIGEKKINSMFANMKPWTHAIPCWQKSKFAFVSLDAFVTFLFLMNNEISEDEYNSICDNYFVESFEINTWSAGLSKFLCTFFDDEVEPDTLETIEIKALEKVTAEFVFQDDVPKEDIHFIKDSYYKKIKTYYK